MMNTNKILNKSCIISGELYDVVKNLLINGWIKKKDGVFYKERNTYTIEVDGLYHPLWSVSVTPKSESFSDIDWKLTQDLNRLKNLGRPANRKLYLGEENKADLTRMMDALKRNKFNIIYDNNYIILRSGPTKVKIFKIAATMDLVENRDGWYVGEKKIF